MQVAQNWRLNQQRYQLVGEECPSCHVKIFPPRDVCPECKSEAKDLFTMSGFGEIYSYSVVYHAPAGYEFAAPYVIALIKLDEGPIITAQLADIDAEEVLIGMRVEMVTRKLREEGPEGMIIYGYKFRPPLS